MAPNRALMGMLLSASLLLQVSTALPALAVVSSKRKDKQQPAGTLLLPLTPKLSDDGSLSSEPQGPSGTLLLPLTPKIDDGTSTERPLSAKSQSPAPTKVAKTKSNKSSASSTANESKQSENKVARVPIVTTSKPAKPLPPPPRAASAPHPIGSAYGTTARKVPASATKPGASSAQPTVVKQPVEPAVPPVPPRNSTQSAANSISAESGTADAALNAAAAAEAALDDEKVLKGTVQIIADDTEYDQEKNTFLGTGNAVAIIGGQNSKLEADSILYDQNNNYIDARGNVKILRDGQLTTGSSFKFRVDSDEYLITDPDTELQGTQVVARTAKGEKQGIAFKNGAFTMPKPIMIVNNAMWGPQSSSEMIGDMRNHPDAYVTTNPTFQLTGRKMIYERYKTEGNLVVYGAKMKFKNFSLPLGKFTANVGGENSRVVLPHTPLIGNNLMVGGTNIGPQFNYAVGKTGAFSWAPLVQIGGATATSSGSSSNSGKIGAGFKIGYSTDNFAAHVAYGSVSNLVVADLKYRFDAHTHFQSGVNRYLNDGMFGQTRARLRAELVDNRALTGIPYLTAVNFRTSGGWYQDDPALVNLAGSQYSQLFTQTHTNKVSGYKLQEQISATTHPIFNVGDTKYGVQGLMYGGVNVRAYSTGNFMSVGQIGPMLNARANRARFQLGYIQSAVSGKSPFVFDEFIQGNQSVIFNGDIRVAKWLTLGTALGYNLNNKMMYTKAITAAIGPDDCKLLIRRDFITGFNRVGFSLFTGQPVRFDKLVIKNGADAGQLGAGIN